MKKYVIATAALMLIGAGCAPSGQQAPAAPSATVKAPAAAAPTVATETAPVQPASDFGTDADHDGLFYEDEMLHSTDPKNPDTDGDGLADGDELRVFGTDPTKADTDGDGYPDGAELKNGYDPLGAGALTPEAIAALKEKFKVNPLHQPTYDTLAGSPLL